MVRRRTPTDGAYKACFSDKAMVASLVQDFVQADFVQDMDFSTLEPFPTARVTKGFSQRYGDAIWRLHWQNMPSFLFLMLEFQSRIDPFMPVRILVYAALLWQFLIDQGEISPGDRLPPIFPIVLYNGRTKWHAARDIKSLLCPMPKDLLAYQPTQKFFLIDENALSQKVIDAA
ncbi:MAG: Rpn family recombination-promoting nuclease/putative transposase [Desulfovibrio sp.]|nr:Rpn family recombination-promoting nuclease/putative transposase [Desulfovibrio sp.]